MAPGEAQERWQRVSALFAEALECEPAARAALLASAEPEVSREVESLLAAHERQGPFDRLAAQMDHLRGEALESWTGSGGSADGSPALAPGQRLGRHEIGARLGAGGMGEVYRARDTRLHREVAIKILRRRAQRRPGSLQRFEDEARAASAINHPNIVTVHDIGQGDDPSLLYIVMELVDGESLRQMLTAPWPAELLLHLAIQIADGLVAAHERGMVHGDVKPENILVSRQGVAKIVDFGLAHYRVAGPERSEGTRLFRSLRVARMRNTLPAQTGEAAEAPPGLLGTPGYMAPEILSGRPIEPRSDQFSLGAILHEMATGAPAFDGRSPAEKLLRTLGNEPPALSSARPDLPAALVRAVSRCLEKDPERRYASMRELLDELRAARRPVPLPRERTRVQLPAERTRLIGRQRELEELEQLLGIRQVRLLTLTGPGGTGKTRLALKAAERLAPRFPGGVFFVPLASITDPALVAPTIAQEIGATGAGRRSLSAVIAGLRDAGAPTLLVLDNFEQVVDAAPELSELLAACPDVTMLVTSRQVLRLYGEHGYPVAPLALPDLRVSAERLGDAPAVALFVERAQAANPAFALTAENAGAVAAVCAGLDGLPLALELAAAQTRLYAPEAMLARLEHRLGLLTGGARDLPGRQQTLRRTLDWSHQLLEPTEQAVFRRLGVFGGSFTVEAAQAVADPYGKLGFPIEQALAALADQSLLQPREALDGEPRFSMLETLREYALEKLAASGEDEATRRAHAAYFLVLAEDAAVGLVSTERPRWVRRFETEHDNFRGALEWLTRLGEVEWALRLAVALFHFWERGEHLAEGRRRLGELLALESSAKFPGARARAMFAAGVLASDSGDIDAGIALCRQSLELYRVLEDQCGVVVALVALGNQYVARGDPERAREMTEESLRVWEQLGDQAGFARSLSNLAFMARAQGRFAEARALYRQAAATFERLGDRVSHAWAINHEGDVAREHDDIAAAQSLYEQAHAIFRTVDDSWGIASSLADLGAIARQRGDRAAAHRLYREALASFVQLDHRRGIARVLETLACLAAEEGALERGLKLAAIAGALRDRVGAGPTAPPGRDELAVAVAAMHRALGLEAARRLWQEGSEMSVEEGLRLAADSGQ